MTVAKMAPDDRVFWYESERLGLVSTETLGNLDLQQLQWLMVEINDDLARLKNALDAHENEDPEWERRARSKARIWGALILRIGVVRKEKRINAQEGWWKALEQAALETLPEDLHQAVIDRAKEIQIRENK